MTTAGKVSVMNGTLLLMLTLLDFGDIYHLPMVMSYQWHKILHIAGIALFFGNMIAGPVWFIFAWYSGKRELQHFAVKLLQLTDLYITVPAVFLALVNGLCLASAFGGTSSQPWLFNSVLLLLGMWLFTIPTLYYQEKLYHQVLSELPDALKLRKYFIQWGIWGALVTIPPTIIFYQMVMKGW